MSSTVPTTADKRRPLDDWRSAEGLSYGDLGRLLGVSDVTARRLALGIRAPDADMVVLIARVTHGAVSVVDMHATRCLFLGIDPAEAGTSPGPATAAGPQAAAASREDPVSRPSRDISSASSPLTARDAAGHSAGDLSASSSTDCVPAAFSSGRHPPALDAAE